MRISNYWESAVTVYHKQELIDVLISDSQAQQVYCDEDGRTCAIGGIAEHMGWIPRVTRRNGENVATLLNVSRIRLDLTKYLVQAADYFGLTRSQLRSLQIDNDYYDDLQLRRAALRRRVESWEEVEA